MKKCDVCGFEGRWLTHMCPGPADNGKIDPADGRMRVYLWYPTQIIDIQEIKERRFGLAQA